MKKLNEQINEIVKSNAAFDTKSNYLKQLGLTNIDIFNLLGAVPRVRLSSYKRTFGVEIENNANADVLFDALNDNAVAVVNDYHNYNHNDSNIHYKIMSDASVCGCELVSPILKNHSSLKKVCQAFDNINAKVDKNCGLHVHIGTNITFDLMKKVAINYKKLQSAINKFMPQSRIDNKYCRPIPADATIDNVLNKTFESRYFVVNIKAFAQHGTIEFRQHSGTTNYAKIKNWVNFCIKLVNYSETNILDNEVDEINEIPFLSETEIQFFESRSKTINN